jgi:hypothetical protein
MSDLGKAFSFPFKDPNWVAKFLLGAVFMVLCIFLVGFFILAGYYIQVTQRVMRREQNPLPDWTDIGVMLVLGFKYCIVYCVYLIPIMLAYIPLLVLAFLGVLSEHGEAIGVLTGFYAVGVVFLFVIPYSLFLALISPIIAYRFASDGRISEALDIGAVIRTFRRNWQNTVIVALIGIGTGSFATVGVVFMIVGVLFTIFYAYLVNAYLHGVLFLEQASERIVTP